MAACLSQRRRTKEENNTKIKEKIAKLLALADSPNEHEAKSALLKARALMVEYKLRPEDCTQKRAEVVNRIITGTEFTSMTDIWMSRLAETIASHYCCKSYLGKTGQKSYVVFLVGLDDDVEIAERILLYAVDCIHSEQRTIKRMKTWQGYSATQVRLACNEYGLGFVAGLDEEYRKQDAEHQEWGLVMSVPTAVNDLYGSLGLVSKRRTTRRAGAWADEYRNKGVEHGRAFKPDQRLAN